MKNDREILSIHTLNMKCSHNVVTIWTAYAVEAVQLQYSKLIGRLPWHIYYFVTYELIEHMDL
jgi:hypothetical protein